MNTWNICRKELNSYFRSWIAYASLAFFAIVAGFFFWALVANFVRFSIQSSMQGQSGPMSVNEFVVRPLFSNISVIALFLIPMITMRLFAEEKRSGTIELLITSPVSDWEIILGKWLAAVLLYASMLGISLLSMLTLFIYGKPDWKPVVIGYLGLLLLGGGLLAIGTYISTTTRNQIVAGMAGFAISILLYVINWASEFGNSTASQVFSYLSVQGHLDSFSKGVLDLKDIVYYLSVIFVGLFLTARSLEAFRWRA
jgi:ABC-2 type transport system permease protein